MPTGKVFISGWEKGSFLYNEDNDIRDARAGWEKGAALLEKYNPLP
ncbi:MAG: hypothetical protein ABSA18_03000 [Dehalococcoidia bacterium]